MEYCIGFSTAITRSVNFIHALRISSGSHERIAVVELFGRYWGETSLVSAYLSGADRADLGGVGGHLQPSPKVCSAVSDYVRSELHSLLKDTDISFTGDDITIVATHTQRGAMTARYTRG